MKSKKYHRKRKISRGSRTKKGSSSYIKHRKEAFAKRVHRAMTHKVIYSNPDEGAAPAILELAAYNNPEAVNTTDTAVLINSGTGLADRVGNHIDILYQRWGVRVYANVPAHEAIGQIPLGEPGVCAGVYFFLVYSAKGRFSNLLANLQQYFTPGGVFSGNAAATVSHSKLSQWYDPNDVGFFIKKVKQVRLPVFSATQAIPGNPPVVWDSNKAGNQSFVWHFRQTQKWKYANDDEEQPLTERPFIVYLNNYPFPVQVEVYNKTVFVDAN